MPPCFWLSDYCRQWPTPPALSEGYVADLTEHGFTVDDKLLDGRDHDNIIRSGHLIDMVLRLGAVEQGACVLPLRPLK